MHRRKQSPRAQRVLTDPLALERRHELHGERFRVRLRRGHAGHEQREHGVATRKVSAVSLVAGDGEDGADAVLGVGDDVLVVGDGDAALAGEKRYAAVDDDGVVEEESLCKVSDGWGSEIRSMQGDVRFRTRC